MPGVFYVRLSSRDPIAMRNVKRTLDEGVPIDEIRHLLDPETLNVIQRYHPGKVFAWGSLPSNANRNFWSMMRENDYFLVLIDQTIRYIAKILAKKESSEIARVFWGERTAMGETWELIYFLTPPIKVYVPENIVKERTRGIASFSPRGLNRFSEERLKNLERMFGTIQNFIISLLALSIHEQAVLPPQPPEHPARPVPTHDEIVRIIKELGLLLNKFPRTEEPIPGGSIDVAWRKDPRGAPYIVFEVHFTGNLHADLAKLKYARDIWNSIPVLITDERGATRAQNLLQGPFMELREIIRIIKWQDIIEIYNTAKKLVEKHEEIGGILFRRFD